MTEIIDLAADTAMDAADLLVFYDVSASVTKTKKITKAQALSDYVKVGSSPTLAVVNADEVNAPAGAINTLTVATGLVMGATLQRALYVAPSVAIPTCAADAQVTATVTLTGAVVGDMVLITPEGLPAGLIVRAQVTGANTVTVYVFNATAASITGANYTVRIAALRLA